jgi:hypothetical protein
MNQTLERQQIDEQIGLSRWMALVYNNDTTPYDLVVLTVIAATHCSVEEAEIEVWEARHYGKAPIHFATQEECDSVAEVIRGIGVKCEVLPEWKE